MPSERHRRGRGIQRRKRALLVGLSDQWRNKREQPALEVSCVCGPIGNDRRHRYARMDRYADRLGPGAPETPLQFKRKEQVGELGLVIDRPALIARGLLQVVETYRSLPVGD